MGGGNKLHPECLHFSDIFKTVRDPMSRIMRKECKKRGIKSLWVLSSCEESVRTRPRDTADIHERSELGTASFMPPIMGQMIAASRASAANRYVQMAPSLDSNDAPI